jgi:peptidoglycan/xylan/chitin deacetylase (PgdA/CDA1 family)
MSATSDQSVAGNGRGPVPPLDPTARTAANMPLRTLSGPHVALTFDVDGFTNWIGSLGALSPGPLSRGEFEHVGLPRVLALLREYRAPATFFVPGSTAVTFPHAVGAIVSEGHEIGHHGWVHEPLGRLSSEQEQEVLMRGLEALDRVLGVRPLGYRSPSWDNSQATVRLLLEQGFEYDSSLMGNDVEPYWCRVDDFASQDEGFRWGTPVPLVELPVGWHLDDHPYFVRVEAPGVFNPGLRPPSSSSRPAPAS